MSVTELATLDATAQAALVSSKQLSPIELVEAAIERIERLNPTLNALIHFAFESAIERARGQRAGEAPFTGVPLVMKDIGGAEAGQPYHAGMAALKAAGRRESHDSYFTTKLRAAGFVSLGRTNLPELAILPTTEPVAYGPTRNPYSLEHSAGGSSGGAAAAVASGMVAVAHGSDGGGSIRGPANLCGLVGLKPTRGRCSFGPGVGERWSSLSAEFMLTRSVRDCAALLDLVSGAMPGDPYFAPPPARPFASELGAKRVPLRIGVMRMSPREGPLQAECQAAVDQMAKTLEALGHQIELAYPAALDEPEAGLNWFGIVSCNVARGLAAVGHLIGRELGADDVEPHTWAIAEVGRGINAARYLEAVEYMHAFGRRLRSFWSEQGFDLLLTPVQAKSAPKLGEIVSSAAEPLQAILRATPYGVFTLPFNLSGQPAIALPTRLGADGTPIGTQLVAEFAREDLLLRVAAEVEAAAPWAGRRPSIFG